jgi:hypothetical protein
LHLIERPAYVVPEWERPSGRVGWTDPEGLRPFLGHFCWHTTLQTADWYTPAAGLQQTSRWSKRDSNPRSPMRERWRESDQLRGGAEDARTAAAGPKSKLLALWSAIWRAGGRQRLPIDEIEAAPPRPARLPRREQVLSPLVAAEQVLRDARRREDIVARGIELLAQMRQIDVEQLSLPLAHLARDDHGLDVGAIH